LAKRITAKIAFYSKWKDVLIVDLFLWGGLVGTVFFIFTGISNDPLSVGVLGIVFLLAIPFIYGALRNRVGPNRQTNLDKWLEEDE